MAKARIKIETRFKAVKAATQEAFEDAIQYATNVMEGEAEKRLERIDDTRGYELPIDVRQKTGSLEGEIEYPQWYGRFFEYGTVHIPAAPYMRPAHRKGKRALLDQLDDKYEGTVKRRARVQR